MTAATSAVLNQCHFDVLFKAYERPFTAEHRITFIRYFKHIVQQFVKFGPNFATQLVYDHFLEDLLRLRRFPSVSNNLDLFNRTTDMIDMVFGSFSEVAKVLTISQLYELLATNAPHAVLRALEELHTRLPELVCKANEAFRYPSIDVYIKRDFPSLLGVLPHIPAAPRPATASRSQSNEDAEFQEYDEYDEYDNEDRNDDDNGEGYEEVPDEVLGGTLLRSKRDSSRNSVAFADDYLSQSTTYFRNQKKDLDRALHGSRQMQYPFAANSSVVYRHPERRGQEIDFVSMTVKYEEVLKQFEVVYHNVDVFKGIFSSAIKLRYPVNGRQGRQSQNSDQDSDRDDCIALHTSIICRLGQVLSYHCNNDLLCNLLWEKEIIALATAYVSEAISDRSDSKYVCLDNDETVFSLGYVLLLFFRKYRGDISEFWVINDSRLNLKFANLHIIKHVILRWSCEITTKSLFTILAATLLRCPQLCSDFVRVMSFNSLVKLASENLLVMMESTAYLVG